MNRKDKPWRPLDREFPSAFRAVCFPNVTIEAILGPKNLLQNAAILNLFIQPICNSLHANGQKTTPLKEFEPPTGSFQGIRLINKGICPRAGSPLRPASWTAGRSADPAFGPNHPFAGPPTGLERASASNCRSIRTGGGGAGRIACSGSQAAPNSGKLIPPPGEMNATVRPVSMEAFFMSVGNLRGKCAMRRRCGTRVVYVSSVPVWNRYCYSQTKGAQWTCRFPSQSEKRKD